MPPSDALPKLRTPLRNRIIELVRTKPGITQHEIAAAVYGELKAPPDDPPMTVRIIICQMNKPLAAQGWRLRGRMYEGYRLERIAG